MIHNKDQATTISVCIPTYNRAAHLSNCLQSIISNKAQSRINFQVCVSDNCSTDETEKVVLSAQQDMAIKYRKNPSNLGAARNFLEVVQMADGEFVWVIGDDDLLLPNALGELHELIRNNPDVDYVFINSYHLSTQYVFSFPQPFSVSNLPERMEPCSPRTSSGSVKFMELVDPKVSFDFLGGIFLSVFRRKGWIANADVLDAVAIADSRVFSHFDNTFPQIKIFAKAFANSKAFFSAKPLSVCLTGAREWAPMYSLIRSVRLVEALSEYRRNGLPYIRYLLCKNYALNAFLPDLVSMYINRDFSGYSYIKPLRLIVANALYPNVYFSVIYYALRKLKAMFADRSNALV